MVESNKEDPVVQGPNISRRTTNAVDFYLSSRPLLAPPPPSSTYKQAICCHFFPLFFLHHAIQISLGRGEQTIHFKVIRTESVPRILLTRLSGQLSEELLSCSFPTAAAAAAPAAGAELCAVHQWSQQPYRLRGGKSDKTAHTSTLQRLNSLLLDLRFKIAKTMYF